MEQRSALLRGAVRAVRFVGDFVLYSKKCSSLFFMFLRLATNHYRKLFETHGIAALLRWVVAETDAFGRTLRLQLFQGDTYRHVVCPMPPSARGLCCRQWSSVARGRGFESQGGRGGGGGGSMRSEGRSAGVEVAPGRLRIIKNHGGGGGGAPPQTPSPPSPQTKVTIVGKNDIYDWGNLVGPLLVHKL